jgi:hypothetical protein
MEHSQPTRATRAICKRLLRSSFFCYLSREFTLTFASAHARNAQVLAREVATRGVCRCETSLVCRTERPFQACEAVPRRRTVRSTRLRDLCIHSLNSVAFFSLFSTFVRTFFIQFLVSCTPFARFDPLPLCFTPVHSFHSLPFVHTHLLYSLSSHSSTLFTLDQVHGH